MWYFLLAVALSHRALLDRLLERLDDEGLELEYKAARGGLPKDIWPTVSAFANTSGGWIVLGVSESGIGGVRDAHGLMKNFSDLVRDRGKISFAVCGARDMSVESVNGAEIVLIRVPAAARKDRPVFVGGNPYRGTYLRQTEGDYVCSKPEVDRMMREASDSAADSTVLPGYGMGDIDVDSLAGYRRRFQTSHPSSTWNNYDDREFLTAVGGWGKDREKGVAGLRVAGLLMLGCTEAILDWRGRHLIDYRLLDEGPGTERWRDRITWEGNLYRAVEMIFPRLVDGIENPFRLEGATRLDESPVHQAVREAFINLLVHADYAETDASLILRSPQEYIFRNPGSSRVPEFDLYSGVRSDPRNPTLVRMFRQIGLAEEAGSGIPTILSIWKSLGFRMPEIDSPTERYEFTIRLRHIHLLEDDERSWLASLGDGWSEAEQLALVTVRREGEIDNVTLRKLTGIHSADATKVLVSLRDRGFLEMHGGRRDAHYSMGLSGLPGEGLLAPADHTQPHTLWDIGVSEEEPSPISSARSPISFSESLVSLRADLGSLSDELWQIAAEAHAHRHLPARARDELVRRLCEVTSLSVSEIAVITARSVSTARAAVWGLLASSQIEPIFPESPSHPSQRYRAIPPNR